MPCVVNSPNKKKYKSQYIFLYQKITRDEEDEEVWEGKRVRRRKGRRRKGRRRGRRR